MVEVRKLRPEVGFEPTTLHTTRIGLPIAPDDVTEKPSLSEHTCKYGGAHPPTGMARVAQLGERRTSNPKVVGSNPTSGRSPPWLGERRRKGRFYYLILLSS